MTSFGEAWSMVERMRRNGWTVTITVRDDVMTPDYRVSVKGAKTHHGRWNVNGHAQGEGAVAEAIDRAYDLATQIQRNWDHLPQPPSRAEMRRTQNRLPEGADHA